MERGREKGQLCSFSPVGPQEAAALQSLSLHINTMGMTWEVPVTAATGTQGRGLPGFCISHAQSPPDAWREGWPALAARSPVAASVLRCR